VPLSEYRTMPFGLLSCLLLLTLTHRSPFQNGPPDAYSHNGVRLLLQPGGERLAGECPRPRVFKTILTLLKQMDNAEGGHDLGSMLYLNAPRVWEADKEWQ
jgi:hypothetical protein